MQNFNTVVATQVQDDAAIVAAYETLEVNGHVLEKFEEEAWLAAVIRLEERQCAAAVQADPATVAAATERTAAAIAVVEAKLAERAEAAFEVARKDAAKELAKAGDGQVAAALRGDYAPEWGNAQLRAFLNRPAFAKGKRGRFHTVVEATLERIAGVLAEKAREAAEAKRIRQEAQRRQEANRRDRAAKQSRAAKGGKKS